MDVFVEVLVFVLFVSEFKSCEMCYVDVISDGFGVVMEWDEMVVIMG